MLISNLRRWRWIIQSSSRKRLLNCRYGNFVIVRFPKSQVPPSFSCEFAALWASCSCTKVAKICHFAYRLSAWNRICPPPHICRCSTGTHKSCVQTGRSSGFVCTVRRFHILFPVAYAKFFFTNSVDCPGVTGTSEVVSQSIYAVSSYSTLVLGNNTQFQHRSVIIVAHGSTPKSLRRSETLFITISLYRYNSLASNKHCHMMLLGPCCTL